MSRGFRWTLGLVLAASAIGGLVLLWPTETKRVTRMVERFAADASFKPGDGNIVRLAKMEAVTGRFAADAQIRFESLGIPVHEVSGRDEIRQVVALAQKLSGGLDVKVYDVVVTFGPQTGTARVELTASMSSGKQEGFTAQEFALQLVKREGAWLIQRAESVKTLRR